MDKYTKHRFFTALVLEIRASLYSTPSDAIFLRQVSPFSETHRAVKIKRAKFIFFYVTQHITELLSKTIKCFK